MGVNTNERWRDVGFFFSLVYFCFVMGFFSFGAGYAIVLFWGFLGWVFFFCYFGGRGFSDLDLPFVDSGVLHLDSPVIVVGVGGLRTRDPVLGRQKEALKLVPYPDVLQKVKR